MTVMWSLWLLLFVCAAHAIRDDGESLPSISIAVTACGKKGRFHAPSFLQSLIAHEPQTTRRRLSLYVFGDDEARRALVDHSGCLSSLQERGVFKSVVFRNISDFSAKTALLSEWWKEDKQRYDCAAFKLDMVNMVPPDVNRIIYMDIDTVAFGDLAQLFERFSVVPGKTMHAALESYATARGWYADPKHNKRGNRKRHFMPPTGLNSGVLLMDLALMRAMQPPLDARQFLAVNDEPISMGDQDVINSWAWHHQSDVAVLPCKWNRRTDSDCSSLEDTAAAAPALPGSAAPVFELTNSSSGSGGGVLHASRRVFMRHVVFPRHYELHRRLTADFFASNGRACNLSALIASAKRGNSVSIL